MRRLEKQDLREIAAQDLAQRITPYLAEAYGAPTRHKDTALSPEKWLDTLAGAIRDEISVLSDAVKCAQFAFVDALEMQAGALALLEEPSAPDVLSAFARGWADLPAHDYDTADAFFRNLRRQFKDAQGLSGMQVMQPIRAALTGSLAGPCLVVVSVLLGKDRCLERVSAALKP